MALMVTTDLGWKFLPVEDADGALERSAVEKALANDQQVLAFLKLLLDRKGQEGLGVLSLSPLPWNVADINAIPPRG